MKNEIKELLIALKDITKDFIAELVAIILDANTMSKTFTKRIEIIDVLLGDKNAQKAIDAKEMEVPKVVKKEVTLEEVRTKLAKLSRNGHTKEVKALLLKYGAEKLSDIDKEKYEALLTDAEGIKNN